MTVYPAVENTMTGSVVVTENVGTTTLTIVAPTPPVYEDVVVTFTGRLTGTYLGTVYPLVGQTLMFEAESAILYPVTDANGNWSQTYTFPTGSVTRTVRISSPGVSGGPP